MNKNKEIIFSSDFGRSECLDHLYVGARKMFLADRSLTSIFTNSVAWHRLSKSDAAEYPCETCHPHSHDENGEAYYPEYEVKSPSPAPVAKSGRIDHTACDHEKTASARKKCRDAKANA